MEVETKAISIKWNGNPEEVVLKKITWGQSNQLDDMRMKVGVMGNQAQVVYSEKDFKEQGLMMALKSAPFPINLEGVRNLPADIGKLLHQENVKFNKLGGLDDAEKKL